MNLTKKDIEQIIIERTRCNATEAKLCLEEILNTITNCIIKGGEVRVRGLGTLKRRRMKAKKGYDFNRAETISLSSVYKPSFKPSEYFINLCNNGKG